MVNYGEIYDHVMTTEPRYNLAQNSPGFRTVVALTRLITPLSGRSLDVGCGVGFVVEYLSSGRFDLLPFGVDISRVAIERARERLSEIPGSAARLQQLDSQTLPFPDRHFALVTCFDMLEHLDEPDIALTLAELHRVLQPGGNLLATVSCRPAGATDQFGDNLHRTVKSVDWWLEQFTPQWAEFDAFQSQLTLWKHHPRST